ncbi:MAG: ribosomal protein S18-alanine N-acetyltransferase [Candidatus Bathyarchaeota archaeon]|nr:ribosomal protein S18-alanine N-acetyltransferase [Candidatus Bathyarchaeota archaeon]MDW8040887.1 ribosomal protein S18-alanine N-acetyltransferase [Nitrososphaerota archaeon]
MPITIEDALLKHLDRLYEIEMECFKEEAFTRQQIAQLLQNNNTISLIAKEDGNIVGFIIGMTAIEENTIVGHILTIDVSPSHRRKGVGIKLLQEMEKIFKNKHAEVCRLEVREDNIAALNLYRKLGYKKIGKLEYYYGNAHGILLEKPLL